MGAAMESFSDAFARGVLWMGMASDYYSDCQRWPTSLDELKSRLSRKSQKDKESVPPEIERLWVDTEGATFETLLDGSLSIRVVYSREAYKRWGFEGEPKNASFGVTVLPPKPIPTPR